MLSCVYVTYVCIPTIWLAAGYPYKRGKEKGKKTSHRGIYIIAFSSPLDGPSLLFLLSGFCIISGAHAILQKSALKSGSWVSIRSPLRCSPPQIWGRVPFLYHPQTDRTPLFSLDIYALTLVRTSSFLFLFWLSPLAPCQEAHFEQANLGSDGVTTWSGFPLRLPRLYFFRSDLDLHLPSCCGITVLFLFTHYHGRTTHWSLRKVALSPDCIATPRIFGWSTCRNCVSTYLR